MSTTSFQRLEFRCFSSRGIELRHCQSQKATGSSTMCGVNQNWLREFNQLFYLQQNHQEFKNRMFMKSDFGFNQLQHSEKDFNGGSNRVEFQCSEEDEYNGGINKMEIHNSEEDDCTERRNRMEFGQFMAREAILDEEYWTAAWLRAEGRWENRPKERYADSYKKQFAEQEFNAIKRRCKAPHIEKCSCIIVVKKDEGNTKHTPFESVVGNVDLSIRHLLQGQSFPEAPWKTPTFSSINRTSPQRYGYVANLSVAKSARRLGIARNMMHFAIETAKANSITANTLNSLNTDKGVEEVFIHVHRENKPARYLYEKMGFQIVENATPHLASEKLYLLLFKA